jgi:hypothetical protein
MRPTERLQRVRRHIRQAEQIVEQQATVVAALKLHGNNSDDARNLLGACTDELGRHRADLERLLEGPDVAPQAGENAMLKGWRVKFIHGDHLHIFLVGISDKDAAKSVAVGDRTGVKDHDGGDRRRREVRSSGGADDGRARQPREPGSVTLR